MTLARKTPLSRGTSQLARTPFKRSAEPKPRRKGPPKVKDTPRPRITTTAQEKVHMGRVAELACLICHQPAEVHHCRAFAGAGQRSSAFHTIPLCPNHHRLGGSGVAIHAGIQSFERIHGTERDLLAQTLRMLGFTIAPEDLARPDLGALLYPPKE